MNALLPLVVMLTGYLLGSSILSAGWRGRWWGGIDLRELGSRAPQSPPNVLRQMGKGPALVVILLDCAQGQRRGVGRQGPASSRS